MDGPFTSFARRKVANENVLHQIDTFVWLITLLVVCPARAIAQSGSPLDTEFNSFQDLFTGRIAEVASLIVIVIGDTCSRTANPARRRTYLTLNLDALIGTGWVAGSRQSLNSPNAFPESVGRNSFSRDERFRAVVLHIANCGGYRRQGASHAETTTAISYSSCQERGEILD